jgi:hypothetical protein
MIGPRLVFLRHGLKNALLGSIGRQKSLKVLPGYGKRKEVGLESSKIGMIRGSGFFHEEE